MRSGAGGTAVGIVPSASVEDANPHCTHVVATGIGYARNLAVVASARRVIAVGGEWGTLSEIGHARTLGTTGDRPSQLEPCGAGQDGGRPGRRPGRVGP